MPQLIRTPEDIFRAEKRDVYALSFLEDSTSAIRTTWAEMEAWLRANLPNSPFETLAPSEHSGWIMGGPLSLGIHFTDADLQRFSQIWETPDGQSRDPRFQCYQMPYQVWWQECGHFQPTLAQPDGPGVSIWIETPLGILSHVLTEESVDVHPGNEKTLWVNACAQWPQLQAYSFDDMNFGEVIRTPRDTPWSLHWYAPVEFMHKHDHAWRERHWRTVADWLCLPPDADVTSKY